MQNRVCVCVCVYLSVICPYDRCVRWMSVEYETHTQLIPLHRTELPSPLTSGLLFPSLAAAEMIAPPSRPPSFPPPFPSLNRTSGRLKKKASFCYSTQRLFNSLEILYSAEWLSKGQKFTQQNKLSPDLA